MSYQEITGNLFASKAEALVNTVNCEGFMGKGIALEFRRRFPAMFAAYKADCAEGKLETGGFYVYGPYASPSGLVRILNFAIKKYWRNPSDIAWIRSSLEQFGRDYVGLEIKSVAFPWMGAQNGGIPLEQIKETTRRYLVGLPDIDVEVYTFDPDAPDPLFEELRRLAQSGEAQIERARVESGMKRRLDPVIEAVQSAKVGSLARLAEARVVGETSLDKLYQYLAEQAATPRPASEAATRPQEGQLGFPWS